VTSFNGRTGTVVPVAGDYAVADVTGLTAALAGKADDADVTAEAATRAADDAALDARVDALEAGVAGGATQAAHAVLAGPTTGSPAAPTFRALVAADVPTLAQSQVTNLVTDLRRRWCRRRSRARRRSPTASGSTDAATKGYVDTAVAGASGATTLNGLTDVDTSGALDGDVLSYDSTSGTWGPAAASTGSGGDVTALTARVVVLERLEGVSAVPGTPNAADDEFDVGSALDTTGARRTGATAWTQRSKPASGAILYESGRLVLQGGASPGGTFVAVDQPAPSGAWAYEVEVEYAAVVPNWGQIGFLVGNTTSNRWTHVGTEPHNTYSTYLANTTDWSGLNVSSWSATMGAKSTPEVCTGAAVLRLERDGSGNLTYKLRGPRAPRFRTIRAAWSETSFITGGVTRIGVMLAPNVAESEVAFASFRRVV
jgi:hypothetical protein